MKKRQLTMLRSLLFLALLLPLSSLFAQTSVRADLDSTRIYLGDQIQLRIALEGNEQIEISKLDVSVFEELKVVELLEEGNWEVSTNTKGKQFQKILTITSFDTGFHLIPKLLVAFEENGLQKQISTNETGFKVSDLPEMPAVELAPIKDIEEEPFKLEDLLPIIYTFLGLLAIAGIILISNQNSKKSPYTPPPPAIVKLSPQAQATQALKALEEQQLWQQNKIKSYHSQLTRIVRVYLEQQFKIAALDKTTTQIVAQLNGLGFDDNWQDKLKEMLQAADLIKFAKGEPNAAFHERMMEYAQTFVVETGMEEITNEIIENADAVG